MAKSFVCRRTPQGIAVMEDTMEHLSHSCHRTGKQCGQHSPQAWVLSVILAVIHCVARDYESVVPLLTGYVVIEKRRPESNPMWMFWAVTLLVEAYFHLGRIPEGMRISEQAKSIAREIDSAASNPLLEALFERATALEAKGDLKSRQRGFVVALVALCWSISHGFQRTSFGSAFVERLRSFFDSYGIRGDEWEWTVKHSHLTRYDFIGLLSILLHHTGLAPRPFTIVEKRGSARTPRRAAQP